MNSKHKCSKALGTFELTNREAVTVLCSVVKHTGSGWSAKEVWGETRDVVKYFSLLLGCSSSFLSALQLNKTEHSQGFSICLIIKNPLNSLRTAFNFQNKLYVCTSFFFKDFCL